jgi:hypothetical protein
MGAWYPHYGTKRDTVLHYLFDNAQVHHEASADQGHLRFWLLCVRQEQDRV